MTERSSEPIRVVLGDDQLATREDLASILAAAHQIDLVMVCATTGDLRTAIGTHQPDVIVIALPPPPLGINDDWIRVIAGLRHSDPAVGAVVLSHDATPELVSATLSEGADGRAYILKQNLRSERDLLAAITAVAAGGSLLDPHIVDALPRGETRINGSAV